MHWEAITVLSKPGAIQVIALETGYADSPDTVFKWDGTSTNGTPDDLTTYWLVGPLETSARDQVEFLSKLASETLPFAPGSATGCRSICVGLSWGYLGLEQRHIWLDELMVASQGNTFFIRQGETLIGPAVAAQTLPGVGKHLAKLVNVEHFQLLLSLITCCVTMICPQYGLIHQRSCDDQKHQENPFSY